MFSESCKNNYFKITECEVTNTPPKVIDNSQYIIRGIPQNVIIGYQEEYCGKIPENTLIFTIHICRFTKWRVDPMRHDGLRLRGVNTPLDEQQKATPIRQK